MKINFKEFFIVHLNWFKLQLKIIFASLLLGVVCGFVMVGFTFFNNFFKFGFSFLPYFTTPMIAGILTGILVKYGKMEQVLGTGVSRFVRDANFIDFYHLLDKQEWKQRIKNTIGKTCATSWTYGSGMLCGLEGPGLFIGSSIGFLFAKFKKLGISMKDGFFIGASACTGAIMRSPISGALFCAELPYYNNIRYQSLLPSILASAIAFFIHGIFFGFNPFIEITFLNQSFLTLNLLDLLIYFIIFGIIMGIFVLVLMSILKLYMNALKTYFSKSSKMWLLPILGSIGYSILLLISIPFLSIENKELIFYSDPNFVSFLIYFYSSNGKIWITYLIFLSLFILALFLSIGTYNSAGIISPLILLGALCGGLFGAIFCPENIELFILFILLGMSAVLGAALNNPITAIFIIVEMTWAPFLFIPAGITTIIAYIFSGTTTIIPEQQKD
ncbi:MAG: chloride channel protein [Promethearchaeota archaeon]